MEYTTAQIKKIIKGRPVSEIERIIDEYIHDSRNREITRRKLLHNEAYEPISERYGLTPRQTFNIVRDCCRIIVQHIQT